MEESSNIVASGYDAFYAAWGRSPALRSIWREHVTGPDFPEEFAHISFLRLAELESLRDGLNLAAGQILLDLACGAGGPGLWVARHSGARLVGIDLSPVAVQRAAERAPGLGMAGRAAFRQGTFEQTGLDTASADAVMSVDALQYAPDKTRAFAEIARVVQPGGRVAFVAFELDAERVKGLPVWRDPVGDYRPLLKRAGFEVLEYRQLAGWRDQLMAGFAAVIAAGQALETELGQAAAQAIALEASITADLQPYSGHVLAVACRT
jgi:cyclopropane fatty-acyl-phospholipid synthase-like methyltransferase